MEPKKLFAAIGGGTTTIIAVILFVAEYNKVIDFFFPDERQVSYSFFTLVLFSSVFTTFYIMYTFLHKEKTKYLKEKTERENLQILLTDSKKLSFIDDVTGISNEKKFQKDLLERPKELFQLIFLDLDGFGLINKKHGFQRGDEIIRTIAQEIFNKMRRDEKIYKRSANISSGFMQRVYRKYTGGDELIFLIKGQQFEAVGFVARLQEQLDKLSDKSTILNGEYTVKFHAAIVPLEPEDTYEDAKDNMNKIFKHAIEELEGLKVYWDKEIEADEMEKNSFIYEKARRIFSVNTVPKME